MTKTELKGLKVEQRKEELAKIFEDPEGEFEGMTGSQLDDFIDNNWDEIESFYEEVEDGDSEEVEEDEEEGDVEEEDEADADAEPESSEGEVSEASQDLSRPNPRTDLYSGSIRS